MEKAKGKDWQLEAFIRPRVTTFWWHCHNGILFLQHFSYIQALTRLVEFTIKDELDEGDEWDELDERDELDEQDVFQINLQIAIPSFQFQIPDKLDELD